MTGRNRFILVVIFFGIIGSVVFVSLPVRAAEDTCACYCATVVGAVLTTNATTIEACRSTCAASNDNMATCASSSAELPSQNTFCFTKIQCDRQGGTFDPAQASECLPGSHYCYSDTSKDAQTSLQVSIGSLKVTGDFGEYISSAYKWLLGASTTIAIVLLMVAGLRWSLGGLSADQIGSAKRMARNAITGLVLMLFTYLILLTINPQLLKLQVPEFPMIRQVGLITGEDSCEYLLGEYRGKPYLSVYGAPTNSPFALGAPAPKGGNPYTIKRSSASTGGLCGSIVEIEKDWEGNTVVGGTCTFTYCADKNQKCIGSGSAAQCVKCNQVFSSTLSGNSHGLEASEALCESLAPAHEIEVGRSGGETIRVANYCNLVTVKQPIGEDKRCMSMSVDCRQVTSCDQYSSVSVIGFATWSLRYTPLTTLHGMTPEKLCQEDVCRLDNRFGTTCVYMDDECQAKTDE
jgi:hypothetical protein